MKLGSFLFILLLTGCSSSFENGKCYRLDINIPHKYGEVIINKFMFQYNRYGTDKNKIYGSPEYISSKKPKRYAKIQCPKKFKLPYSWDVEIYKDMGIWEEIKRTIYN